MYKQKYTLSHINTEKSLKVPFIPMKTWDVFASRINPSVSSFSDQLSCLANHLSFKLATFYFWLFQSVNELSLSLALISKDSSLFKKTCSTRQWKNYFCCQSTRTNIRRVIGTFPSFTMPDVTTFDCHIIVTIVFRRKELQNKDRYLSEYWIHRWYI